MTGREGGARLAAAIALLLVACGGEPASRADERAPPGAVEWIWSGALGARSARVVAGLLTTAEPVRLRLESEGEHPARSFEPARRSEQVVSFELEELAPAESYSYTIEVAGSLDPDSRGHFRTPGEGPFSFLFAFGSCAETGSDHPVFDTVRGFDPLFLLHLGDLHYENVDVDDPERMRAAYRRVLTSPAQARLFRSAPIAYVWDDHDFGGNNSDSTAGSRRAAQRLYRQLVPHYPLAAGDGARPIYQAFTIGRVRFLLTDSRSARSTRRGGEGSATLLGSRQKQWLEEELLAARDRGEMVVWANTVPWLAETRAGADHWGRFPLERLELAGFLEEHGLAERLVMLSGDAHMLAIDDGSNNRYLPSGGPGFPVMHAAAFDRRGSVKGGPYSEGTYPGRGQFGLMRVEDDGGAQLRVTWSGRDQNGGEVVGLSFDVALPPAAEAGEIR